MKDSSAFDWAGSLKTLFLALLLASGIGVVQAAWTGPLSIAPNCTAGNPGCDAPLNVSSADQTKVGDIYLTGIITASTSGSSISGLMIATSTLVTNAVLQVGYGTTSGATPTGKTTFLPPRVTTAQRNAIAVDGTANPALAGLLVYNADAGVSQLQQFDGKYWRGFFQPTLSSLSSAIGTTTFANGVLDIGNIAVGANTTYNNKVAFSVGKATTTPAGNIAGMLPPRVTTAQRNTLAADGIANPALAGLLVYNDDATVKQLQQFDGRYWRGIIAPALSTAPAALSTSTFSGGINVQTGCVAVNGVCADLTSAPSDTPTGMISFFDVACPTGWTAYAGLSGRYPVGTVSGATVGGIVGTALSLVSGGLMENRPAGAHNHDVTIVNDGVQRVDVDTGGYPIFPNYWSSTATQNSVSQNGKSPIDGLALKSGTNAPYVQLTACRKI